MIDPLEKMRRTRQAPGHAASHRRWLWSGAAGQVIAEVVLLVTSPNFGTRSAEDLDIFLKAEVISDPEKTAAIQAVLVRPAPGRAQLPAVLARSRLRGQKQGVKVDLLAAPAYPPS